MPAQDLKEDRGQKPEEAGENTEFARLLAESERSLTEGEVIRGHVLQVTNDEVIIDIGYKSEGMIPRREFSSLPPDKQPQPGQQIAAILERTEDQSGYVILSYEKARRLKAWDAVEAAFQSGAPVKGRVLERVKGGLAVDIGVRAFLPGSIADIRPLKNLDVLRGRELEFRVVGLDKKRGNIVLSRKAILEEVADARKTRWPRVARCAASSRTSPTTARSSTWAGSTVSST